MNVGDKKKKSQEKLYAEFFENGFQPPENFNSSRQKRYGDGQVLIPIRETVGYAVCDTKTERAMYVSAYEDSDEELSSPPLLNAEKNKALHDLCVKKESEGWNDQTFFCESAKAQGYRTKEANNAKH